MIQGRSTWLRPAEEQDLDLLAGWFAEPDFVEHWGGVPLTRSQVAEKYIGRRPAVKSYVVLAGDSPIGYAQYWQAGPGEGGLDMVLVPSARGQGYGPDAGDALATYLLGSQGWSRVTADPEATNVRAVRAWEKAGFRAAPESPIMERLLR